MSDVGECGWPSWAPARAPHEHVSPQLQAGPHWHEGAGRDDVVWQPHLHSEPLQTAHVHTFD
jgi:hypothetical protein